MKFGEKYELRESLTTGAVETFVANDKIRGQRVLVHILDCGLQQPNQPTVQWALDAFRHVAPEPAGLVLEAGRYSGTLYAYIVTQMPEKAVLTDWVQRYQAQATDTHEIPAPVVQSKAQSDAPTADSSPAELARPSTPFTQAFQNLETPPKPKAPEIDLKKTKPDIDIRKTRLFAAPQPRVGASNLGGPKPGVSDSGASKPGEPAEAPRFPTAPDILAPPASVPQKTAPIVTTPPDFYRADLAKNAPSEPVAPAAGYSPKPGEFTSFFQGPFHGDEPTPVRGMSQQEVEPPRKSVGEFTAVFGPVSAAPQKTSSETDAGMDDTESGLNVGWLNDSEIPRNPNTTSPAPAGGLPRAVSNPAVPTPPIFPPQPASYVASGTPIFPTPLPAKPAVPPVVMPPIPIPSPVAATPLPTVTPADVVRRAFSNPGIEPIASPPAVSSQPAMASSPSPYTQIIKRQDLPSAAASTGAEAGPVAAKPAALPKMAPPPAPKIAAPEAPKLDKPAAPPTISYWPLILTLTVLFFIAVLLVLYFVLKH
ncbi:MAG: hypothetical protein ACLQLC_04950 [Candidatus Sulfotelmatobacter sp.]